MRCLICNSELTSSESVAKDNEGNFRDTCSQCSSVTYKTLSSYEPLPPKIKPIDNEKF